MVIEPSIFKAYDIRGVTNRTFTPDVLQAIGYQLGLLTLAAGKSAFVIGRDGRGDRQGADGQPELPLPPSGPGRAGGGAVG